MPRAKRIDLVHTGPETLAGRFIRSFWQPVYLSRDLEKGWAKRIQILNEYLTLYRGDGGEAHLVQDRCPHRNTQLSIGWIEGDEIRCFYHGWKFAPDGRCTEQPCEKEGFARKVAIRAYPTREYLGLIFAYLGEGEAPPFPRYPEIEEDNGHPLWNAKWDLPHNFFQRMENDLDEAHVHFVHKTSADLAAELAVMPDFDAKETDYGILRIGTRQRGDKTDVRYSHMLMPNTTLIVVPPSNADDMWAVHLAFRVPVTDDKTQSFVVGRRKPRPQTVADKTFPTVDEIVDAVLDGRMRMKDVDPRHPMLFNIQDNVALAGQGAVYDDRDSERLGRSDAAVILLRKLYERELGALAGGKPIKTWRRPSEKLPLGFHTAKAA
jgi:5,5'-dehydrodivanillate O-demethylase